MPAPEEKKEPKLAAEDEEVSCPDAPDVKFVDPKLEEEVRKKLQKPEGEITRADLKKVRSINLSQGTVDRLDPCIFPLLTELRDLALGRGPYTKLDPIKDLKHLTNVRISLSKVSDISALEGKKSLDRLDLGKTQVSDLSPLANATALTELVCDGAPVEDLTPLAKLVNLEKLDLKGTKIKDLEPLLGLKKLKFLYVKNTPLQDTFVLAPLRKNGLVVEED